MSRESGTIRFFDTKKGYGFVTRDGDLGDVHISTRSLPRARKWDPDIGDRVSFEVRESDKGLFAAKVDFLPSGGRDGARDPDETQNRRGEETLHRGEEPAGGQDTADGGGSVPDR